MTNPKRIRIRNNLKSRIQIQIHNDLKSSFSNTGYRQIFYLRIWIVETLFQNIESGPFLGLDQILMLPLKYRYYSKILRKSDQLWTQMS